MECPNCFNEMVCKREIRYIPDLSGTADDEELEYVWEQNKCKKCGISYEQDLCCGLHGKWKNIEKYAPTEKQKKTILFINSRLHLGLEALTKRQCWRDINKYFDEAKETPKYTDEDWLDIQEAYGMDYGDFC